MVILQVCQTKSLMQGGTPVKLYYYWADNNKAEWTRPAKCLNNAAAGGAGAGAGAGVEQQQQEQVEQQQQEQEEQVQVEQQEQEVQVVREASLWPQKQDQIHFIAYLWISSLKHQMI